MTEDENGDVQVGGHINRALGGFALALGLCLFSAIGSAAGPSGRPQFPELRTFLASSDALSEAAMARQSGMGLNPPAIITNDQSAGPRVRLWDELKLGPLMAPVTSGMTTGGSAAK